MTELILSGLNGGNPLGFLAALGVFRLLSDAMPGQVKMSWRQESGGWRPVLVGHNGGEEQFVTVVHEILAATTASPFDIDKKLPFQMNAFRIALQQAQRETSPTDRRTADLLVGLGSDVFSDDDGKFSETSLRMVRSGDAAGQGLPAYALAIRTKTDAASLFRSLFTTWDYQDDDFSLRWDPVEDQRYALRWYDPSPQSNKKYCLRTMRGANALALEALSLLPVQPIISGVQTTGFFKLKLDKWREFFTWPIWKSFIALDTTRSLLALPELYQEKPHRETLRVRGILEVYRCERMAPNKYYKNFGPAQPV